MKSTLTKALIPKKVSVHTASRRPYVATRWVTPEHGFGIFSSKKIEQLPANTVSVQTKETFKTLLEITLILAEYELIQIALRNRNDEYTQVKLAKVEDRIASTRDYLERLILSYQQLKEKEVQLIEVYEHPKLTITISDRKRSNKVKNLLNSVPNGHIQYLTQISEKDSNTFVAYNQKEREIVLGKTLPIKFTLYYGLGLHVYSYILSEQTKKALSQIFNKYKGNISHLSLWANTNELTFFCESYRLYLTERDYLKEISPYIYKLLAQQLFKDYIKETTLQKDINYLEKIGTKPGPEKVVPIEALYLLEGELPPEGYEEFAGPRGGRYYIPNIMQFPEKIKNIEGEKLSHAQKRIVELQFSIKEKIESLKDTINTELDPARKKLSIQEINTLEIFKTHLFLLEGFIREETLKREKNQKISRKKWFDTYSHLNLPLTDETTSYLSDQIERVEKWPHGAGSNEIHQLVLKNGTLAVFKPISGYSLPKDIINERAAYLVDRHFKFNRVPPTIVGDVEGRIGSIQQKVEIASKKKPIHEFSDTEINEARVFDAIIRSQDRHSGNYLTAQDGTLVLIDHGYSFFEISASANSIYDSIPSEEAQVSILESTIAKLEDGMKRREELKSLLLPLLGTKAYTNLISDIQDIIDSGII